MQSAEEVLKLWERPDLPPEAQRDLIILAMKHYATQAIEAQIEIAVDEAEVMWDCDGYDTYETVDRCSIRKCTRVKLT